MADSGADAAAWEGLARGLELRDRKLHVAGRFFRERQGGRISVGVGPGGGARVSGLKGGGEGESWGLGKALRPEADKRDIREETHARLSVRTIVLIQPKVQRESTRANADQTPRPKL
eukprot:893986-Rhodomonas_salina.1